MALIKRDIKKGILRDFNQDYRVFFEFVADENMTASGLRSRKRDMDRFMVAFNRQHASNGLTPVLGNLGINLNVAVGYAQAFQDEFNAEF